MTRVLPWLLLVGVAWFGGCQYANGRDLGAEIERLEDARDSLRVEAGRLDSVYLRDTVRLTRWSTRWDRLTDTLRLTDTVWVRDVVLTADSTIKSCQAGLSTCEAEKATLRSQLGNIDSLLTLERERRPSRFGCAAPLAVTTQGAGLGVACGVRFGW